MSTPRFNGPLARLLLPVSGSTPDPWPAEIDAAAKQRDAIPLCLACLCPQETPRWLCPHCAFPAGNYSATMPFITVFVEGELFRRGVSGPPERNIGQTLFLILYSIASYNLFAPIYWFWLFRKATGKPISEGYRREYIPAAVAGEDDAPAPSPPV